MNTHTQQIHLLLNRMDRSLDGIDALAHFITQGRAPMLDADRVTALGAMTPEDRSQSLHELISFCRSTVDALYAEWVRERLDGT